MRVGSLDLRLRIVILNSSANFFIDNFMENLDLNDFYNGGFGWICKPCERELKKEEEVSGVKTSRLMSEGEAESKQPKLSVLALAKWADKTNRTLICPRCGITEPVDKF